METVLAHIKLLCNTYSDFIYILAYSEKGKKPYKSPFIDGSFFYIHFRFFFQLKLQLFVMKPT